MGEVMEHQNMENVCRLCLSTDEPKSSVFGTEDTRLSLASMIQGCLSIQISATDKLSTQICAQCVRNVNQWHSYKDECLRSQDKLQQWLEKRLHSNSVAVTVKSEPIDLNFHEDNIEIISESSDESDLEATNIEQEINHMESNARIHKSPDEEIHLNRGNKSATKEMVACVKPEPHEDSEMDCTMEVESVTGAELVLNPLAKKKDTIMEADSTQKSNTCASPNKKKIRRGPHTHFRGTRVFKQKCVHCQINLHSKYSYTKHMERFHSSNENGNSSTVELQDDEELVEDMEEELMSMEKDAPLTQVQQNIISQLKTFSCYSCEQTFTDRKNTLSHIRQHMPDLRPYTCIPCLTEFPDRSMYKLHCGSSFECAMKIALVIPTEGEEKYFTCNMCLRSLSNRKELLSHLSKHSDKQYEELISPTASPPTLKPMTSIPSPKRETPGKIENVPSIPLPYKNGDRMHNHMCDLCGMIYRYRPNMLKHKSLCQRLQPEVRTCYRCAQCGMTYLVFKKFQSHITMDHKKKELVCSICFSKLKSASEYLTHHETHRKAHNKKQFNTSVKDEPLDHELSESSPNISLPIKDWDTFEAEINAGALLNSNRYSCALCNLDFDTRAELSEHRNLHLKVKIYSCVICRSMFSSAGALEIHMKDHGIEDPNERNANISCIEYGTIEDDSEDSNSINVSATSDPGVNKNECDMCGKIFSNTANLKRHIRNIHKTSRSHITCSHCLRMFKSKEMRDRHVAIEHSKNAKAMLHCPQCPKTFIFHANLNLHAKTAHGRQSYGAHKCDICGKEFAEEASLKIHRSWHNRANSRLSVQYMKDNNQKPMEPLVVPKMEDPLSLGKSRPARARKSFPNAPPAMSKGNFQCQVCSMKFSDITELRKHLLDVHYSRNKAERSFSVKEFQCILCTNVFPDKETLEVHMQWHRANPVHGYTPKVMYNCDICGKCYSSKKVLTRHKKLHKATNVATMKFQSLTKNSTTSQFICNICHRMFCSERSLHRHNVNLHSDMFMNRSQSMLNNVRMEPQSEPKSKKVKLELEDRKIQFPMDSMSAGRKTVMCHICRKFFLNMSDLYKHKQTAHNKSYTSKSMAKTLGCIPLPTNDGKVSCNICFKKFPTVPNLRQHFTVKHKLIAPKYACPMAGCKLMFPTLLTLKNHELSHTSMIFTCTICGRHVFSRHAMTNHVLTVHKIVYDASISKNYHREMDLNTYTVPGSVNATCPRCNIKYPNYRAMKIHYFKFHEDRDN